MRGASLSINAKKTIDSQWVVTKEEDVVYKNGASNEAKMLRELFWRNKKTIFNQKTRFCAFRCNITHYIWYIFFGCGTILIPIQIAKIHI